jgi:DTW domain-containing protein YfiP
MQIPLCVCEFVARARGELGALRGRVLIPMHAAERKLPTNTARFAVATIPGCEIRMRGFRDRPMDEAGFIEPGRETLFLYPAEGAEELRPVSGAYTLVVPDGSWRQARKVAVRERIFRENRDRIRFVKLPPGPPSRYLLRRETAPEHVCTFEAVARALGVLEGPAGVAIQASLELAFEIMIERSRWARGLLPASECVHPIPQGIFDYFREMGSRAGLSAEERARRQEIFQF